MGLGEGKFIEEDGTIAMQAKGQVALNIISPWNKPVFPPECDSVLAWCFSENYFKLHENDKKVSNY